MTKQIRLLPFLTLLLFALAACTRSVDVPPPVSEGTLQTSATAPRVVLGLNDGWRFRKGDASGAQGVSFNDSSWQSVAVPHTWNALDGQDGGSNYYRGVGWYRRHLTVPTSYSGKRFYLEFGAVNQTAEVWVNGAYIGQHRGGYSRFRLDSTDAVKVGADNVIAVKANNAYNPDIPPLSADFTFFGGMYRDVNLVVTDKLQIKALDDGGPGVYLTQKNVSRTAADLAVQTKVWNNYPQAKAVTVVTRIKNAGGTTVKTLTSSRTLSANAGYDFTQTTTISSPHLWNGRADPYLYTVEVEVKDGSTVTDALSQPLGFRYFRVDADDGFFLNGNYLDLHGVNRHQDRKNKGWAISRADHDEDMALIEEVGATAIRLAHYQHDDYFYDLADRNGMVVWAEIPLVNQVTNSAAFRDNAEQQMRELILQNYNRPSIIFWGIGNEQRSNDSATNSLLADLDASVKSLDPTRLTTYAHCCNPDTSTLTTHADTIAYNKYFGWYGGSFSDFARWADNLHASRPNDELAVSEYGAGANVTQHEENPPKRASTGQFHPEEYQNAFHEAHWLAMKTRPFLWGKFVWNMFDFASDGRNEGGQPGINDKGLVTYDRKTKKDAFYWYKANWSDEPVVYISSRRFTDRTDSVTDIKVYANTASVDLRLNGVSLGSKTSTDHRFTWKDVTLSSGSNVVEAVGSNGQRDRVTWTLSSSAAPTVRVNAGSSSAYTDGEGRVYSADRFYSGGSARTVGNAIGNTADDPLFQSYRFGMTSYDLPVENGTYDVYLKFVEPYRDRSGQRVFSVSAEGSTKLTGLDVFSEVGKFTALEKRVVVTVNDGVLNLGFNASVDAPILTGLAALKR